MFKKGELKKIFFLFDNEFYGFFFFGKVLCYFEGDKKIMKFFCFVLVYNRKWKLKYCESEVSYCFFRF